MFVLMAILKVNARNVKEDRQKWPAARLFGLITATTVYALLV